MRLAILGLTGAFAIASLQACSDGDGDRAPDAGAQAPTAGTAAAGPAGEPILALGLTRRQLEDADLKTAGGVEIGEVEAVISDASGAVVELAVEVEGTTPDRFVRMPLDGLRLVETGDDRDLQTDMTRDALLALPEWSRPGQPAR